VEDLAHAGGEHGRRDQAGGHELPAHHLPAVARATKVLLLVRLEARLHQEQAGARRRGRELPFNSDHRRHDQAAAKKLTEPMKMNPVSLEKTPHNT
jgi:hypothetical protein